MPSGDSSPCFAPSTTMPSCDPTPFSPTASLLSCDDDTSCSLQNLVTMFLATLVDAKDFVGHLETSFCNQVWPTFCSEIAKFRGKVAELEMYIDDKESERIRLIAESDALRLELETEKLRFETAVKEAERCVRQAEEKEKNEIYEKLEKFEKGNLALEQRLERLLQDNLNQDKQRQRLEETVLKLQEGEKLSHIKEMHLRELNQTLTIARAVCEKSQALKVRHSILSERKRLPRVLHTIVDKDLVAGNTTHEHSHLPADKNLVQSLSGLHTHKSLQEHNDRLSKGLIPVNSEIESKEQTQKGINMDPDVKPERTDMNPEDAHEMTNMDPDATQETSHTSTEAAQERKQVDPDETQEFVLEDSEATQEGTQRDPRAGSDGYVNLGSKSVHSDKIVGDAPKSSVKFGVVDKIPVTSVSCEQAPQIRATTAAEPAELVSGRDCPDYIRVEQKAGSRVTTSGTLRCKGPAPGRTVIHKIVSRSRGHSWRKTRSRAEPRDGDPHDSFLATPRESVLAQLAVNRKQDISAFNKTLPGTNSVLGSPALNTKRSVSGSEVPTVSPRNDLVTDKMKGKAGEKAISKRSEHFIADSSKSGCKTSTMAGPDQSQKRTPASKAPAFKFNKPARKKRDREQMLSADCNQCRKFYEALASQDVNAAMMFRCERHAVSSRHRFQFLPPATPKGFWEIDFDSSS